MDFHLVPVTLEGRARIAQIIIRANWENAYGQPVWPNTSMKERIARTSTARRSADREYPVHESCTWRRHNCLCPMDTPAQYMEANWR